MEINEGWSKGEKNVSVCACVSHARVSAHVLHIVLYPAAANPSEIGTWMVCERGWQRGTDAERQGGREERKEGDQG